MRTPLFVDPRMIFKTIGVLGLFVLFTHWILTCNGTSPLLLIPVEKYIELQNYFGATCCESAADFDSNLSMLIALPFTALTFWLGLRCMRFIKNKRNN